MQGILLSHLSERSVITMTGFKRVTALLGLAAFLCVGLSGCSDNADQPKALVSPSVSEDDSQWATSFESMITMENETVRFEMNAQTTHFAVTVLATGKQYHSVPLEPGETLLDDAALRLASELTVCYYDDTSTAMYMYSSRDSVECMQYTVKSNGNAVRIYYQMGAADQVVPAVLTQQAYDGIAQRLANDAVRRRLERYYVLYSSAEQPEDYAQQLKTYPVLSKQPLYILQGEVMSDSDKEDLSGYLSDAGYTVDEYKTMLAELGIDNIEIEQPAGFVIPVEYRLAADGFTAEVLTDRIQESSPEYKLQSVELLEYFASADQTIAGNFVVPDGSGALIAFNHPDNVVYSQPYYGKDCATEQEETASVNKALSLPIFGMSMPDNGILAIVERAAEVATLYACPAGTVSSQNHIYAGFAMRSMDVTENDADWFMPRFNLLAKERLQQSPRVRYVLLDAEHAGYEGIALRYRQELQASGSLNTQTVSETPLYLDYLCMFTEEASMLGFPYTRKTVLSTLPEIMESVRAFHDAGVGPIVLRLAGYSPSGLENSAYNTFRLDPKVGTVAQLEELASLLASKGGQLYLDADIQFAYNTGNAFSLADDASHYLNRMVVRFKRHNLVTRDYLADMGGTGLFGTRYLVSPANYADYAARFRKELEKVRGQTDTSLGLAYSSSGQYLGGDYGSRKNVDRAMSASLLTQALRQSAEAGYPMLFDNGNAYVLPYAAHLLNVPLQSSGWDVEAVDIPLYQMVVHGAVSYAGTPINVSKNNENAFLESVALGSSPYYALITRDDSLLAGSGYAALWYSLSDRDRVSDMAQQAKRALEIAREVQGQHMTKVYHLTDCLSATDYENGKTVYVNYGSEDVVFEGITIPARGFLVK